MPESIQERIQQVDNPISGTVSFSGADYKAIVFLPIKAEALNQEIKRLFEELSNNTNILTKKKNIYNYISSEIDRYASLAAQALEEEDMENYSIYRRFENDYIRMRNASVPSLWYIETLEGQLDALQNQINRLEQLSQKNQTVVRPIVLGDLQTMTISSFREKMPVRTLGRTYAKTHVRGARTIAGSLIFTLMNKHALWDLVQAGTNMYNTGVSKEQTDSSYPEFSTVLVDQLPPFDITILASNEVGDNSYATLYGIDIVSEGTTMSIQDLITESVMQFVARDYDPLRPIHEKRLILQNGFLPLTPDNLLKNDEYLRRKKRLNPYI